MIEMGKTYGTRDGREVRIYAIDAGGYYPVHGAVRDGMGWKSGVWSPEGRFCVTTSLKNTNDLIPADPHGILPRHRELLAEAMVEHKHDFGEWVEIVRTGTFTSLSPSQHVALIALARLESSLRSEVGE